MLGWKALEAVDLPTPSGGSERCHGASLAPRSPRGLARRRRGAGRAAALPLASVPSRSPPPLLFTILSSPRRGAGGGRLKPIPVNELSGAPGKGGDRRGQGGGRRAGPRARPPIPRPPEPGARPRAPFGRSGRGRVTLGSEVRRLRGRFCGRPLGGAEAARGGDPVASSFRARPPVRPPARPASLGPRPRPRAFSAAPQQVFKDLPPLSRRAFFSLLGCFQLPHQHEETQTMMWENYRPSLKSLTSSKCRAQLYLLRKRRCRYFKKSHTGVGHSAICRWKPSRECS